MGMCPKEEKKLILIVQTSCTKKIVSGCNFYLFFKAIYNGLLPQTLAESINLSAIKWNNASLPLCDPGALIFF